MELGRSARALQEVVDKAERDAQTPHVDDLLFESFLESIPGLGEKGMRMARTLFYPNYPHRILAPEVSVEEFGLAVKARFAFSEALSTFTEAERTKIKQKFESKRGSK